MADQERINKLMKKSKTQFLAVYPSEREKIVSAFLSYLRNPEEEEMAILHRLFHNMKGVTATLGLSAAAEYAEKAEDLLERESKTLMDNQEEVLHLLKLLAVLDGEILEKSKEESEAPPVQESIQEDSVEKEEGHAEGNVFASNGLEDMKEEEEPKEESEEFQFRPKKSARILVLDDDVNMLSILEDILRAEDYEVLISSNPLEAMELLLTERVDLALIDVLMPKKSGFDVHKYIIEQQLNIPVILITALKQESVKDKALRLGIDHLITKPIRSEELLASVEGLIGKNQEHQVESIQDDLTGAFTRKFFSQRFKQEVGRHKESGEKLSIAFVDVDGFSSINDEHGHLVGDQLLKKFYTLMRARIDLNHEIFRYGGDMFVLMFPWTNGDSSLRILEELRTYVEDYGFYLQEIERSVYVTISAGVAEVEDYLMPLPELLKEADEALYRAKELGRNKVIFRPEKRVIKSKRILVVDDSPFILDLIRNRLSHLGYELDYAVDGEEALEKVKSFQPELVLLDLMLPKMNGLQVLKKLNEDYVGKVPPIIVVSAKNKEKDIVTSFSLGVKDFITKPFSLEVMEEKIKKYI